MRINQYLLTSLHREPATFKKTITGNEREKWKNAVIEELESVYANQIWTLVDRPTEMLDGKRANIIDSRWVFKKN